MAGRVAGRRTARFSRARIARNARNICRHHSDRRGLVRYRQLEYRMPYLAFFAMENANVLPYAESYLAEFEKRFCYDRYCDAQFGTDVSVSLATPSLHRGRVSVLGFSRHQSERESMGPSERDLGAWRAKAERKKDDENQAEATETQAETTQATS
jgi:hypothetical protein